MAQTTAPDDRTADDRARREIMEAIRELQNSPLSGARVIRDVELADSTTVYVPHGLNRIPNMIVTSPVRGATSTGRLVEATGVNIDRRKFVALHAAGWGATIKVDVMVF